MGSNRLMKSTRMIAGLLAGLMFAILAVPLGAETAPPRRNELFALLRRPQRQVAARE